jgi:hypothetical protein
MSTLLAIALVSTSAHAIDTKVYAGINCQKYGTNGTYAAYWGTVQNSSSTQDMQVVCPFVHDETNINSATMRVWDRHTTLDISCDLRGEYASGSSVFQFTDSRSSSGFGSSIQDVNFSGLGGGDYYYAFCAIPRTSSGQTSHIIQFWINEA